MVKFDLVKLLMFIFSNLLLSISSGHKLFSLYELNQLIISISLSSSFPAKFQFPTKIKKFIYLVKSSLFFVNSLFITGLTKSSDKFFCKKVSMHSCLK